MTARLPIVFLAAAACLAACAQQPPTPFSPGAADLPPSGCIAARPRAHLCELEQIHTWALRHFHYASDPQAYGMRDYWVSPSEITAQLKAHGVVVGDCDDFASLVVMALRGRGMNARFVLAINEQGDDHLVAESDGWLLDNRFSYVLRRDDVRYRWLMISGYTRMAPWHSLKGTGA